MSFTFLEFLLVITATGSQETGVNHGYKVFVYDSVADINRTFSPSPHKCRKFLIRNIN